MRTKREQRGFTLLEVALTLAVVAVLLAAAAPIAIRQVELKTGERIAREIGDLLQAARVYYLDRNQWPASVADLQGQYVPASFSGQTPYGAPYIFDRTPERFTIRVTVPQRLVGLIAAALPFGTAATSSTVAATTVLPGRTADLTAIDRKLDTVRDAVINPADQTAIEAVINPTTGQTVSEQVEDLRRNGVPVKGLKPAGPATNMVYAVGVTTCTYWYMGCQQYQTTWTPVQPPFRPEDGYCAPRYPLYQCATAPYLPFSVVDQAGRPTGTIWIPKS